MPTVTISDLRDGRNGIDQVTDPLFPRTQCVEAYNVDFYRSPLGSKRAGTEVIHYLDGGAKPRSIARFAPTRDDVAQMWIFTENLNVIMLYGEHTWAHVTHPDTILGNNRGVQTVTFNGKLFIFYHSTSARPHVYPGTGFEVFRVGIAPGGAPPTVSVVAGTYDIPARYYRVRWVHMAGAVINKKSEPTPSAYLAATSAVGLLHITRPEPPTGEQITHWELDVSLDGKVWYTLYGSANAGNPSGVGGGQIDLATTVVADVWNAIHHYANLPLAPATGTYSLFPQAKFAVVDDNRIVMAGDWSGVNTSRVWFTAVLGTTNAGDDERVPQLTSQTNYIDLNEKDGGEITAIAGPADSTIFVTKFRQFWRLIPTGQITSPWVARKVSNVIGCINADSMVMGEDAVGNPCVYFLSYNGPYRYGVNGLEYLGRDVEDFWYGTANVDGVQVPRINLDATVVSFVEYYADKGQVWWWIAFGEDDVPTVRLRLDVKRATLIDRMGVRGGWVVDSTPPPPLNRTSLGISAECACMHSREIVGTKFSRDLLPYVGLGSFIAKCDKGLVDVDQNGSATPFRAYIKTRSLTDIAALSRRLQLREGIIVASARANGSMQLTVSRDQGLEEQKSTVSLAPENGERRVVRKFDGAGLADGSVYQLELGDPEATPATWSLDAITVNIDETGEK